MSPPGRPAPVYEEPGKPPGRGGADELHELEGQTLAQVEARFGPPTRNKRFPMRACCHEFEIELYNTYPPGAGHDAVEIQQLDWDYQGYSLTVWLHQVEGEWVVLETSRYLDTVEF